EEFEKHILKPDNPLFLEVLRRHHTATKTVAQEEQESVESTFEQLP
ncbi:MAG: ferredoxin, partial [Aquifex sp.]